MICGFPLALRTIVCGDIEDTKPLFVAHQQPEHNTEWRAGDMGYIQRVLDIAEGRIRSVPEFVETYRYFFAPPDG